jgi:hypothetical protein
MVFKALDPRFRGDERLMVQCSLPTVGGQCSLPFVAAKAGTQGHNTQTSVAALYSKKLTEPIAPSSSASRIARRSAIFSPSAVCRSL